METAKLLILADFLEFEVSKQPAYKFNMSIWADSGFNPAECHTAACAAGWATVIFKELRIEQLFSEEEGVTYGGQWGYRALSRFFEVSEDAAHALFGVMTAKTPKGVANNIRKFVKDELT